MLDLSHIYLTLLLLPITRIEFLLCPNKFPSCGHYSITIHFQMLYSGYRLTRRHSLPMKIVPLINESRYDIQSDEGKSYIFADTPPRSPSGTRLCTSCTSAGSPPTATSSESASPRRRRTRTRGASPTSSWISPHSDSTETSSPSEKGESASV